MSVLQTPAQSPDCGIRTVLMPRIQSMHSYILRHHKRLVLRALNEWRQNASANPLTARNTTFTGMSFWRWDAHTLLTEITVTTNADGVADPLYCELWVDMRRGMTLQCGQCGPLAEKPERHLWKLSEYLVPILSKDDIEQGAEALLQHCLPGAYETPQAHDAEALARQLGLQIVHLPLHQRSRTRSILFFRDAAVLTAVAPEDAAARPLLRRVPISANTVVINTNAVKRNDWQLDVFHECIHYAWHFMFFRLQDMHHSDINQLQSRHQVVVDDKVPTNPLTWMEWQARLGSFSLMMPLSLMQPLIRHERTQLQNRPLHAGQQLDLIARKIALDRDWPKFRVRARLLQMGYVEAKGTLNYVDGTYIEPFAFSRNEGSGLHSFVIDRQSVFWLYRTDAAFRTLLANGAYVWADGHLCRNDPRYIRSSGSGCKLTPWANAHVDRCCMRFIEVYERSGLADYSFGTLNSDESYNRHYLEFVSSKQDGQSQLTEMHRILTALPPAFPEALTYLMRQARVTIEQLEEKTGISARTISRLRTEERREYTLDQVIAICVALHLPTWLSRELLQRAGLLLRKTRQHLAYQCVLDCMFMDEVEDVQRFLLSCGLEKLKPGKEA